LELLDNLNSSESFADKILSLSIGWIDEL